MATKTIKDVDERTWRTLKGISADFNMPMGRLLDKMVEEYSTSGREFWKTILEHEKILTDKEAEELIEVGKLVRKERGFR